MTIPKTFCYLAFLIKFFLKQWSAQKNLFSLYLPSEMYQNSLNYNPLKSIRHLGINSRCSKDRLAVKKTKLLEFPFFIARQYHQKVFLLRARGEILFTYSVICRSRIYIPHASYSETLSFK